MEKIKVTIIGDGMVGKTSILNAFRGNTFDENIEPTVFAQEFEHSINVYGNTYTLELFDTAGQEDYDRIRAINYPNTDVFILCYAIDNPTSFENIKTVWMGDINTYNSTVPLILVGTKEDLRVQKSTLYITSENGIRLGKSIGAITTIECSAKKSINIDRIFEETVRAKLQGTQIIEESTVEQCICDKCEIM